MKRKGDPNVSVVYEDIEDGSVTWPKRRKTPGKEDLSSVTRDLVREKKATEKAMVEIASKISRAEGRGATKVAGSMKALLNRQNTLKMQLDIIHRKLNNMDTDDETTISMRPMAGRSSKRGGGCYQHFEESKMEKVINYQNIKDYQNIEKLGEGTYGVVSKAELKPTGLIVAMKKIKLDFGTTCGEGDEDGVPPTSLREFSILLELDHENIVDLMTVIYTEDFMYLVFEYLPYDLKKFMDLKAASNPVESGEDGNRRSRGLSASLVQSLSKQLLEGICYCHANRMFHRDLKPQNLLISADGSTLKIADFGLGREHTIPVQSLTHEVVTLWYRCPEVLMGVKVYGGGIDTWSCGAIIAEMSSGSPLISGGSEIDQLLKTFQIVGTPNETTWPGCKNLPHWQPMMPKWRPMNYHELLPRLEPLGVDLVSKLLKVDPCQRISAKRALLHEYIENYPGASG